MQLNIVSTDVMAIFNIVKADGTLQTASACLRDIAKVAAKERVYGHEDSFFPPVVRQSQSIAQHDPYDRFKEIFKAMAVDAGNGSPMSLLPFVTESDAVRAVQAAYGNGECNALNIRFVPSLSSLRAQHITVDLDLLVTEGDQSTNVNNLYNCFADMMAFPSISSDVAQDALCNYFKSVAEVAFGSQNSRFTDYLIYGVGNHSVGTSIDIALLHPADAQFFHPSFEIDEVKVEPMDSDLSKTAVRFFEALLDDIGRRNPNDLRRIKSIEYNKEYWQFFFDLRDLMRDYFSGKHLPSAFVDAVFHLCNKHKANMTLVGIEVTYNITFPGATPLCVWSNEADVIKRMGLLATNATIVSSDAIVIKSDSPLPLSHVESEERTIEKAIQEKVSETTRRHMERDEWEKLVNDALESPFGKYVANACIAEVAQEYLKSGSERPFEWEPETAAALFSSQIKNAWLEKYDSTDITAAQFTELHKELSGYLAQSKADEEDKEKDRKTFMNLLNAVYSGQVVTNIIRRYAETALAAVGQGQTLGEVEAATTEFLNKFKNGAIREFDSLNSKARKQKISNIVDWLGLGSPASNLTAIFREHLPPVYTLQSNVGTIADAISSSATRLIAKAKQIGEELKSEAMATKEAHEQIVKNTAMPEGETESKEKAEVNDSAPHFTSKDIGAFVIGLSEKAVQVMDSHPRGTHISEIISLIKERAQAFELDIEKAEKLAPKACEHELNFLHTKLTHTLAVSLQARGYPIGQGVVESILFKAKAGDTSAPKNRTYIGVSEVLETFNLYRGCTPQIDAAKARTVEFLIEMVDLAISKNEAYVYKTLADSAHGTAVARNELLNLRQDFSRIAWEAIAKNAAHEGTRVDDANRSAFQTRFMASHNW